MRKWGGRRLTDEQRVLRSVPETDFQRSVVEAAEVQGWLVFHDNDSRRNKAGLPDLILAHPEIEVVYMWELKRQTGRLSAAQVQWLGLLGRTKRLESGLYRPSDMDAVMALLKGGKA